MLDPVAEMGTFNGGFGLRGLRRVQADLRMDSGAETQDAVHGMVVADY
jgi:hypothetical protein